MEFRSALIVAVLLVGGLAVFLVVVSKPPSEERPMTSLHLPPAGFLADPARGKAVFSEHCARCHGADARGTERGPPLVHLVYRPGHHADLTFHLAVRNGVRQHHWHFGDMPPMLDVNPEQVEHVIAFVRAQQRQAGIGQ